MAGLITGIPELEQKIAKISNTGTTNTPDPDSTAQTLTQDQMRMRSTNSTIAQGPDSAMTAAQNPQNPNDPITTNDPGLTAAINMLSKKFDNQTDEIVRALGRL